MKQEIVFWKNHPALHDHRLYLALASYYRVLLVCDTPIPEKRILNSGWSNQEGVETLFLSDFTDLNKLVSCVISEHSSAIHVLCGLRASRAVRLALPRLLALPSPKLVVSQEAPTRTSGLSRIIQDLLYRAIICRIKKKVRAFFAMGSMGTGAYVRLGFPKDRIYPTMYSYPGDYPSLPLPILPSPPVKLIYVGDAIPAKGIHLLLDAVKTFSSDSIHLTMVGSVPNKILSRALADPFWNGRLTVLGVVPNTEIMDILSRHDLLILPSLNDGWGMVVTEALIAGIGAIVTDACGSQDIPRQFETGLVIPAGSVSAIVNALRQVIDEPKLLLSWKINARARRDETRPEEIAARMHRVLEPMFPTSALAEEPPF